MDIEFDRSRCVPDSLRAESTSFSPIIFPSLSSTEDDDHTYQARRHSLLRHCLCPFRMSSSSAFKDLSQSAWRFFKRQGKGRDLVGPTCGMTIGTSIVLIVLYALVFVFKPGSMRSNLPHDFISNNPLPEDGDMEEALNRWLTDFSRSVTPKPCHSHNDYWRPYPLFSALAAGCTGVEADIWLSDDGTDLLVGHDRGSLSANGTLKTMYLDPLMKILDNENPESVWAKHTPFDQPRGAFKTDPNATLVLLIDVKSDAKDTWPLLVAQLEPLRKKQFLTRFEHIQVSPGMETKQSRWPAAVTVVGTGNLDRRTFFDIEHRSYPNYDAYHDTFMDAPLEVLPKENTFWRYEGDSPGHSGSGTGSSRMWDVDDTYMTSTSFKQTFGSVRTGFTKTQLAKLRKQINTARLSGIKTRYWGIPDWPVGYRDYIWQVLTEEGVDFLNVDDLESAAKRGWMRGYIKDVIWMAVISAYIFGCGFTMIVMWRRYLRKKWLQRIADANNAGLGSENIQI